MGQGAWSTNVYSSRAASKAASGQSTFAYNDDVLSKQSYEEMKIHDRLEPKGLKWRESRDCDEHPESNSVVVAFDVTGSMGSIPRVLQTKLPKLHGLLERKSAIAHPQVMFAAIGDSYTDRAPLQVGQFESDNRMDEDLEHIWLEGNGGGQMKEGYEVFLWFLANKTAIDCHEKRGKKGYAFVIGDELPYPAATRRNIEKILGEKPEADVSVEELVKQVQERYELYFLYPRTASYYTSQPQIAAYWRGLLGERLLILENEEDVCEVIALSIALSEGTVDLASDLSQLAEDEDLAAAVSAFAGSTASTGKSKALGSRKQRAIPAAVAARTN
jgi:hypothetical protein